MPSIRNAHTIAQVAPSIDGMEETVRRMFSGEMRGLKNALTDYIASSLTVAVDHLQQPIADMQGKLDTIREEMAKTPAFQEQEQRAHRAAIKNEQAKVSAILQDMDAACEAHERVKQQLVADRAAAKQKHRADLAAATNQQAALERKLKQADAEMETLQIKLEQTTQHETYLQTELKASKITEARLRKQRDDFRKREAALQRKLDAKPATTQSVDREVELERRLRETEVELERTNDARAKLQHEISVIDVYARKREAELEDKLRKSKAKLESSDYRRKSVNKAALEIEEELNAKRRMWDRNSRVLSIVLAHMHPAQQPASRVPIEALPSARATLSTLKTARTGSSVGIAPAAHQAPQTDSQHSPSHVTRLTRKNGRSGTKVFKRDTSGATKSQTPTPSYLDFSYMDASVYGRSPAVDIHDWNLGFYSGDVTDTPDTEFMPKRASTPVSSSPIWGRELICGSLPAWFTSHLYAATSSSRTKDSPSVNPPLSETRVVHDQDLDTTSAPAPTRPFTRPFRSRAVNTAKTPFIKPFMLPTLEPTPILTPNGQNEREWVHESPTPAEGTLHKNKEMAKGKGTQSGTGRFRR